jgi:hypothetical protein
MAGEGALGLDHSGDGVGGQGERDEEGVPFGADFAAVPAIEDLAQNAVVVGQEVDVVRAKAL